MRKSAVKGHVIAVTLARGFLEIASTTLADASNLQANRVSEKEKEKERERDSTKEEPAPSALEPDFKPLIRRGFLEIASTTLADASNLQANRVSEKEKEKEKEKWDAHARH